MKKILVVCLGVMLLTGCGGREIDDMAYVVAIGVDRADDEYEFTFAIGDPVSINGEGGDNNVLITEKEKGTNILTAGNVVSARLGQEINFSHSKLIVFSADVAGDGVGSFLDSLTRNLNQRPKLVPAVSLSTAQEVIGNIKSDFEGNPEKYLKKVFQSPKSARTIKTDGRRFLCRTKSMDGGSVIPLANAGGSGVEVAGLCAFYGDRFIGVCEDVLAYKMICADIDDISYDVGDKGTLILNRRNKPKIIVTYGDELDISVYIKLESALASSAGADKDELMHMAKEQIEHRVYNILNYSAKGLNTDIFGFDSYGRRSFANWQEWEMYNWAEKYKTATFNVTVEIESEKTGLLKGEG